MCMLQTELLTTVRNTIVKTVEIVCGGDGIFLILFIV